MASTASQHGYPCPGPQNVSSDEVMKNVYFMSQDEWEKDSVCGDFDYVVVGSSFCALGFTQRMLEKTPVPKILIIERGDYFHPEHVQNLPPAYALTLGGTSETFQWQITEKMHNGEYIKWQHGMYNFFGGRSAFWSAWCPKPTRAEMDGWPESVKDTVQEYFPHASRLLNVRDANQIGEKEGTSRLFGELQKSLVQKLESCLPEAITRVDHAPFAVKADMHRHEVFRKYSVSGPLLSLLLDAKYRTEEGKQQPLKIMTGCLVEKIKQESGRATVLKTSKGDFHLGNAKLILAMGTLPPTTLMLNSFPLSSPEQPTGIGSRFTAHFISSVFARTPVPDNVDKLSQQAAVYIPGVNPKSKHQFHIQLLADINETPFEKIFDTMSKQHLPYAVVAPLMKQLVTSKEPLHIVFVCASLGQLDHANENNWYRLNNNEDITCNATLQVVANDKDNQLWDTMDDSTFSVLEKLDSHLHNQVMGPSQLEYWHSDSQTWKKERPPRVQIRNPGLVHEASTMWISDDESSPVGLDYRFRCVDNVYLTGAALWPNGASWNPACVVTALAMDLADKLSNNGT